MIKNEIECYFKKNIDSLDIDSLRYAARDIMGQIRCSSKQECSENEELLLSFIEKYPAVLTIQDGGGMNIGMYAAMRGMEKVVLKALDSYEASVQQSYRNMYNIGMYAASMGMEEATLKALDNTVASVQQGAANRNIGMISAMKGMDKATLKALKNLEASKQHDSYFETIESIARASGMNLDECQEDIFLQSRTREKYEIEKFLEKDELTHVKQTALVIMDEMEKLRYWPDIREYQQLLVKFIEKHPSALIVQDEQGLNIAMYAVMNDMKQVVLNALDNHEASVQQDENGWNIGMHAAMQGMEEAALKALDNPEASVQQDRCGLNIGMHAASSGREKVTLKALDNHEASVQQDKNGWNIGMHAAFHEMEEATLKAYDNDEAVAQRGYFLDWYNVDSRVNKNMEWNIEMILVYSEQEEILRAIENKKRLRGKRRKGQTKESIERKKGININKLQEDEDDDQPE